MLIFIHVIWDLGINVRRQQETRNKFITISTAVRRKITDDKQ